jgi:hypothetical protein
MAILINTNILLRSVQPFHSMHSLAVQALATLLAEEDPRCIAIQKCRGILECCNPPA